MADEIAEAVQIIRVAYDGIEIAMKVGSDGIEAMKKVLNVIKGMLDYEKNLGRTSMRKLLMRGGDLQVLQFDNSEMKKVKKLAKKYGILYSTMPNINKGQTEIIFHSEATPRINVMLQRMKSGHISTFDDYVKKSDSEGKNKLIDYFQKQKEGNGKFHTQEEEKAGEAIQGLIEKIGLYAVEKNDVSVDTIKDKFDIGSDDAKDEYFYYHVDKDCIRHLFAVASSLDSLVIGEGQILSQVKKAYSMAREAQGSNG